MQRSVSSDQFEGKSAIATAAMAKDPATNVDRFAVQEHAAYSLVFVARAAIVAVSTLASALLGIAAQQFLGPSYVAEARSMTNSVVGLVATLLAVVVGLLVSTSYGLFNSQQTDLETIVRSVARMRFVLRHFGPEAEAASAILRKQILQLKARLWPSDGGGQARKITHEGVHVDVHEMLAALDELRPANDEQRHALGQAREIFGKFIETQGSMIRSLASRVPNLLLNVVMGWACALFSSPQFIIIHPLLAMATFRVSTRLQRECEPSAAPLDAQGRARVSRSEVRTPTRSLRHDPRFQSTILPGQ